MMPTLGVGFEERVQGRGMLVREWVDQRAILAHECVKGFLSHGGWNSALETISAGVPLAVWPMAMGAEQPINAKLVVDELGVGIRVPAKSDAVSGMARSEQIARVTSDLMTGDKGAEVARKMAALAAKAREAVAEAGSSWRAAEGDCYSPIIQTENLVDDSRAGFPLTRQPELTWSLRASGGSNSFCACPLLHIENSKIDDISTCKVFLVINSSNVEPNVELNVENSKKS